MRPIRISDWNTLSQFKNTGFYLTAVLIYRIDFFHIINSCF